MLVANKIIRDKTFFFHIEMNPIRMNTQIFVHRS